MSNLEGHESTLRANQLIERFINLQWLDVTASDQTQGVQTQAYLDQLEPEDINAIARYYLNLEAMSFEETGYTSLWDLVNEAAQIAAELDEKSQDN